MIDLHLTARPVEADALMVGYSCPCGCTPATTYRRGDRVATEGCCCGNEFAVGPEATEHVHSGEGFELRTDSLVQWGQRIPVAWAIGPSTHDEGGLAAGDVAAGHHDHDHDHGHDGNADLDQAIDPVCGMTVESAAARAKGLHSKHQGADYFFCGKGCKLEFDDDPERYLDSSYKPSM